MGTRSRGTALIVGTIVAVVRAGLARQGYEVTLAIRAVVLRALIAIGALGWMDARSRAVAVVPRA